MAFKIFLIIGLSAYCHSVLMMLGLQSRSREALLSWMMVRLKVLEKDKMRKRLEKQAAGEHLKSRL